MIPFNLGLCLLNLGNNIDAIEAFKIAIQIDDSFSPAWGNIGAALIHEGKYQEALPAIQKALELDPSWASCMGSQYGMAGRHAQT